MAFDLKDFPIPSEHLPAKLKDLLTPAGMDPDARIEIAANYNNGETGEKSEFFWMNTAVVPEDEIDDLRLMGKNNDADFMEFINYGYLSGGDFGDDIKGRLSEQKFTIAGYDYLVACLGSCFGRSYALAEKVWLTLGLHIKCFGNNEQRLIYADPSIPELDIASGTVRGKSEYFVKDHVSWRMKNSYLRKYLWQKGAFAVRAIHYGKSYPLDEAWIKDFMGGKPFKVVCPYGGWYEIDLREVCFSVGKGYLLRIWACFPVASPEKCEEQILGDLIWPGIEGSVNKNRGGSLWDSVYLDDKCLLKYQVNPNYNVIHTGSGDHWHSAPYYENQWEFSNFRRSGRNLIAVSLRYIYKVCVDEQILHVHKYALSSEQVAHLDLSEEHIVIKVDKLYTAYIALGKSIHRLAEMLNIDCTLEAICNLNIDLNQKPAWLEQANFQKLAYVSPLDMSQADFYQRCALLDTVLSTMKKSVLKQILCKAGCPKPKIDELGAYKLLQSLCNVIQHHIENESFFESFIRQTPCPEWDEENSEISIFFIINDIRNKTSHHTSKPGHERLAELDFDLTHLEQGYGGALDFVFDQATEKLWRLSDLIAQFLDNSD